MALPTMATMKKRNERSANFMHTERHCRHTVAHNQRRWCGPYFGTGHVTDPPNIVARLTSPPTRSTLFNGVPFNSWDTMRAAKSR
jgi:hypothetical protein